MQTRRRAFLRSSAGLVGAAMLAQGAGQRAYGAAASARRFKLQYASHFDMFKSSAGADLTRQLEFMAAEGFMALEDNFLMERPVAEQQAIGATLSRLGMTMGVFVLDLQRDFIKVAMTTGKKEYHERFLEACRQGIEVAKRVNARWVTVVPGLFARELPIGMQTGHIVDTLRAAAKILEPHGLIMVLEALSDSPDFFLQTSDQAYAICRAVASPSCKILYDVYHMQRNEGNLIERMDRAWDEIAYIQVGDNPGRFEPGTGEINYRNVFRHLWGKGYRGPIGMEHENSKPGKAGERALIEAYLAADDFGS